MLTILAAIVFIASLISQPWNSHNALWFCSSAVLMALCLVTVICGIAKHSEQWRSVLWRWL